jgi:proteasome lid subunit RPN8/RPN11
VIVLTASSIDALTAWARAGYPSEACGLLVGRRDAAGVEVERAVLARNRHVERAPERYELDPLDHLAAEEAALAEGLAVVGVWHSHPDHAARPSERDRAAAFEGWSYVIVAVDAAGASAVRSWRLDGERRFVEEELLVPTA